MEHKEYRKKDNPYMLSGAKFAQLREWYNFHGVNPFSQHVLLTPVIPTKGQAWLTPECVAKVKHFIYAYDDVWSLRVGHDGDEYAGRIGTAFAPFTTADHPSVYTLGCRATGDRAQVRVCSVHPVKTDGRWYWRVELVVYRIQTSTTTRQKS